VERSFALNVPFVDLARATEEMRDEISSAISRVVASGRYLLGSEGEAFEAEFAAFGGVVHGVAVASGTDAIELALRALDVGPGDEVVTQANTCVPTVAAIERAGARPVLCDVEADDATIDPDSLAAAISARTRAIVPVHLYGQCCDMDAVLEVARDRGVPVVEDCAQAHGAEVAGRKAGAMGTMGCFSFYPTKNLGALGDGGMVVTDDEQLAGRLRLLRQYGQASRYEHVARGVNSRLDEIQAAVLRLKLPRLAEWNERRGAIAGLYARALADTGVEPLIVDAARRHVFHLYVVRTAHRSRFQDALAEEGVATLIHYPRAIHQHTPYAALADGPTELTVSERLAQQVVSLPLHPHMTDAEVDFVGGAAAEAARALG
jgi:dTDP-3-amino-3,4,6-trideoxy-alpha-D-glucose transaminase